METERIALSQRIRERGDGALVHGLRGRPSNRKLAARLEQKILARLRQRYADFGPTLAAEHLAQEGFPVSRETLRKWMTKAALWRPRSQLVCGFGGQPTADACPGTANPSPNGHPFFTVSAHR